MHDDNSAFVDVLVRELSEYLTTLESELLNLEKEPANTDRITEISRVLHAIKGLFGFLGENFQNSRILFHQLEDLVLEDVQSTEKLTPSTFDVLFLAVDLLRVLIREIEKNKNHEQIDCDTIFLPLQQKLTPSIKLEQQMKVRIIISPHSELKAARMLSLLNLLKRVATIKRSIPSREALIESTPSENELQIELITREPKQKIAEVIAKVPDVQSYTISLVSPSPSPSPSSSRSLASYPSSSEDLTIEIKLKQLTELSDTLQELLILSELIPKLDLSVLSSDEVDQVLNFSKKIMFLQDKILQLRTIPFSTVVSSLPRLARDLAKKEHKEVTLSILGSNVGLDRALIDHLTDPLIVLVQNAIIHGIEPPDLRKKQGKRPKGLIIVSAEMGEGETIIRVKDDGKGIDTDEILAKAFSLGILDQYSTIDDAKSHLSDTEILDLLFLPGFTTLSDSDLAAGRGYGLYSVAEELKRINASIHILTEKNKGTTFEIHIPILKPIVPILLFTVNSTLLGILQEEVLQIELLPETFSTSYDLTSSHLHLSSRLPTGETKDLLLFNLPQIFQHPLLTKTSEGANESVHSPPLSHSFPFTSTIITRPKSEQTPAIIKWMHNNRLFGFLVSDLIDIRELAINFNDPLISQLKYIKATTVVNNEQIAFIIKKEAFLEE